MSLFESFKIWCQETNRSGGVVLSSSLREFFDWHEKKQKDLISQDSTLLLLVYRSGFNDELEGKTKKQFKKPILNRAYNLGCMDAIVGDDVRSVDYQSDEEILKTIRQQQVHDIRTFSAEDMEAAFQAGFNSGCDVTLSIEHNGNHNSIQNFPSFKDWILIYDSIKK